MVLSTYSSQWRYINSTILEVGAVNLHLYAAMSLAIGAINWHRIFNIPLIRGTYPLPRISTRCCQFALSASLYDKWLLQPSAGLLY